MADINGFPIGESAETGRAVAKIETFRVPGTGVDLPVRSDIAPLLIGLATEFHETVEPLDAGSCWGYAYRLVRGGTTPSFHSAGIAIDLNAPRHPLGKPGTFSAAQAKACRALAGRYGCRWGGDYHGRVDEMHFEIIVSHAAALDLVAHLGPQPGDHSQPTDPSSVVDYPLPPGEFFRPNPSHRPDWHDGRNEPTDHDGTKVEVVDGDQNEVKGHLGTGDNDGTEGDDSTADRHSAGQDGIGDQLAAGDRSGTEDRDSTGGQDGAVDHLGAKDRDCAADREAIRRVQRVVGVTADGIYGPLTLAAVRRWQVRVGLPADGVVGPHTWASLTTA